MAKQPRTFKIDRPFMKGQDIKDWQTRVKLLFKDMGIPCPIKADGIYGLETRTYTAALVHASGLSVKNTMANGVTPELRTTLRHGTLNKAQLERKRSASRREYRAKLKKQWTPSKVHKPTNVILADSWGYHPGVHDGLDVICPANAPLFAMVRSKVIDVRSGGWWGKAPSGNVALGDGIIQLEVLESVGPFKKGMHIGYGHAEGAVVKVGQVVNAGDRIGHAGLAVAWHIHLMVNTGGTSKGIGNLDPRKFLDYAVKNSS